MQRSWACPWSGRATASSPRSRGARRTGPRRRQHRPQGGPRGGAPPAHGRPARPGPGDTAAAEGRRGVGGGQHTADPRDQRRGRTAREDRRVRRRARPRHALASAALHPDLSDASPTAHLARAVGACDADRTGRGTAVRVRRAGAGRRGAGHPMPGVRCRGGVTRGVGAGREPLAGRELPRVRERIAGVWSDVDANEGSRG